MLANIFYICFIVISVAIICIIKREDEGLGVFSAGGGIIAIIVLASLFLVFSVGAAIIRYALTEQKKSDISYLIVKIIVFVLFALYAFTLLYAILWAFGMSLKGQEEYYSNPNGFPRAWAFSNYVTAFRSVRVDGVNMILMFLNSVWYACGGALLQVIASAIVAYVVAKYKFPGRGFLYGLALVTMMIPIVGSFPSQYRVYKTLGILDTPGLLITKFAGFGFNFIVMYSFFKTLSWTYAEAAFIDGASHLRVFLNVMMPMAIPVMGSLFLVATIGLWNNYMEPVLFLQSYPTLTSGLYIFQLQTTRDVNYPVLFAGLLVSVIPVVLLFVFFQNKIMESMSVGGIKG